MKPTSKQLTRISNIILYAGVELVQEYYQKHYPKGKFDQMTRVQAQKIITGMDHWVPIKPILNVYENPFYFRD